MFLHSLGLGEESCDSERRGASVIASVKTKALLFTSQLICMYFHNYLLSRLLVTW